MSFLRCASQRLFAASSSTTTAAATTLESTLLGTQSARGSKSAVSVVLLKDQPSVGFSGEEIKVKPGFARNFLIPQRVAVYATEPNRAKFLKVVDEEKRAAAAQAKKLESLQTKLSASPLILRRHSNDGTTLYHPLAPETIAEKLSAHTQLPVTVDNINITQPITVLGEHSVSLSLQGNKFQVTLVVKPR